MTVVFTPCHALWHDPLYDLRCSLLDGPAHFHDLDPLCYARCQRGDCHLCGKLPCIPLSKHALMAPMITLQPQTTIQDIIQLQDSTSISNGLKGGGGAVGARLD